MSGEWNEGEDEPEADDPLEPGPVERSTLAFIEGLGDLDGVRAPLAATACALSRAIDRGMKDTALAGTARELRETLKAISEDAGDGGMDAVLAKLGSPVLPAPMGDSAESS